MNIEYSYPQWGKLLHAGLAVFGVASYLTAELAEDGASGLGYLMHAYLGMSLMAVIITRMIAGYSTGSNMQFRGWFPFSRGQFSPAVEDIRSLLSLQVPQRDHHQGISGLVQSAGLLIFSWMAATGTAIFFIDGAARAGAGGEILEELHEVGEGLVPLYLLLHVGSVVLHSVAGTPVWQKMWKYGK